MGDTLARPSRPRFRDYPRFGQKTSSTSFGSGSDKPRSPWRRYRAKYFQVKTILLGSVLGAVGVVAVGNTNWNEPWAALLTELPRLQLIRGDTYNKVFMNCGSVQQTCVVDGDTIWLEGVKIRVLDIDAPEISKPNCLTEKALGLRAKSRLLFWLNEGPFEVSRGWGWDQDAYGRKLRYLTRDGVSVGDVLIAEGLAAPWIRRNRSWCS